MSSSCRSTFASAETLLGAVAMALAWRFSHALFLGFAMALACSFGYVLILGFPMAFALAWLWLFGLALLAWLSLALGRWCGLLDRWLLA